MGCVAVQKYSVLSEISPRSNNVLAKTQWARVFLAIKKGISTTMLSQILLRILSLSVSLTHHRCKVAVKKKDCIKSILKI